MHARIEIERRGGDLERRAREHVREDRLALDDAGVAEAGLGRRRAGAVDQRHRAALGLQMQRGRDADDPCAQHDDVGSLQSHAAGLQDAPARGAQRRGRKGLEIFAAFL